MAIFRVNYGQMIEFTGQGAGEVVPFLQGMHFVGRSEDEGSFLRRLAIELCEWSGGWFRYGDRDVLAADMIRHGLLERVD